MKSLCKETNRKNFRKVYKNSVTSEVRKATRYFTAWLALLLFKKGWSTDSVKLFVRTYNNWFKAVNTHTADGESGCTLADIKAELETRYNYKVELRNSLIEKDSAEMGEAVAYSMDECLNLLASTAALTLFDMDRSVKTVDRIIHSFDCKAKLYKAGDKDYRWITERLRTEHGFYLELEVT